MATQRQRRMQWARDCTGSYCCFLVLCIFMLSSPSPAHAGSLYNLAPVGSSKIGHLGFQLKWQTQWLSGHDSYLDGYWGTIPLRGLASPIHNLSTSTISAPDLGLAAMLRYQRNDGTGFYAEAGTGPRYQANAYSLAGRPQSSRLALNALAGVGFVWKNGVDLGFKAIHVTRGQGKDGNDPGNMVGIDLKYRW